MNEKTHSRRDALVVLSGGQDSTTCLYWALHQFERVRAVTFNYGQRHDIELMAATNVMAIARQDFGARVLSHEVVNLGSGVLVGSSPLVSAEPLEQYADSQSLPGGLEKTFVPGRNLLFATIAANRAYAHGCTDLVMGVCQEDFGGYPDCRQDFIDAATLAIREGLAYRDERGNRDGFFAFKIHTPLMNMSKADTVLLARELPGCWNALAYTHTAYDGKYPPTGKDHASLLRAKGFEEAGWPDPLVVRAFKEGLMDLPETDNYAGLRS